MENFDNQMIEHIEKSMKPDEFKKAMSHAGLTYQQKQVSRGGRTFMQGFWTKTEEKKTEKQHKISTASQHQDSQGRYKRQRAVLHKKIVDEVVDKCGKPKAGEKPVCILMGGGSASGKSTMRRNVIDKMLKERGVEAGTVDVDEVKDHLPEFEQLKKTSPDDAARLVHEESADVGALMINEIVALGRNFVYDGTMKSKDKYDTLVSQLKKRGYEVHVYVADVPLDVAKERSDKRAERTGRKVPHSIIEGSHRGVPKTVEHLKDKVDSYQVFDNTDTLQLIASNDHVHPEKYSNFLNKAGLTIKPTN